MNREQAKNIITNTFENSFNKNFFLNFVLNLLKKIEDKKFIYEGNYIPDAFKNSIKSLERIGQFQDSDSKEIDLLIVTLRRETSLERARATQRNFITWYLKGSRGGKLKDAALVAFVSPQSNDWRFSLVKVDYRFENTSSGKFKIKEEFTPAKRWSFLVGKNEKSHTAQNRFLPILENDEFIPNLSDLEKAFDVEVVTKEFFEKYRDLFVKTKLEFDNLLNTNPTIKKEFQNKKITSTDFAKKLLGQIVFLYFLQKKGWFGVKKDQAWGTGPKDFIRKLFNQEFVKYQNFFNDILEPLFYEALRTDRSLNDHFYDKFQCQIPFLNGGLFDPINNYDWIHVHIHLPNNLFSNSNKTKEGDIGDGILDVFDRFNFTVNEEEPLEKEVALDPELLGKIYEKLNAIREDNFSEYITALNKKGEENKFNKEYGVYYTPREIVHYMCQESLFYYLKTKLKDLVLEEDLETFLKLSESILENEAIFKEKQEKIEKEVIKSTKYESLIPESIKRNAKKIDEYLKNIQVCDPAVGSGAFPVGMMHEIIKLRQLLAIYINKEINTYDLKRHTIENSLFGVDIDGGAIETCKLRFWLSLVVDEEDFNNIKPLPNLEYKVVCGNSLLEVEKDLFNHEALKQLEKLKTQYFNETHPNQKEQLKKQIDSLISQITKGHKEFDYEVYFSEVFHQNKGFDIVIGNPPYVQLQKNRGQLANLYQNKNFVTFDRMGDIYCLFYEKGIKFLKPNGHLCFITSNKWMRAGYGEKTRKFFIQHNPKVLIDLGPGVFESAIVDTNILLIQNAKNEKKLKAITYNNKELPINEALRKEGTILSNLTQEGWFIGSEAEQKLKEKIEKIGKPLKDWDVKIFYGIKTGLNEAFIITTEKRNEILANCKDKEERKRTEQIIKPILRGRDIKRYYYKWAGLWVILAKYGFYKEAHLYPSIVKHLKQFEYQLKERGQCRYTRQSNLNISKDYIGQHHWLELDNNPQDNYLAEFEKEKVVYSEIVRQPQFYLDSEGYFVEATSFLMTGRNVKYICGLLNSKPVTYFFKKWYAGGGLGEEGYRYKKAFLENLPIPAITPTNEPIVKQIEHLVDQILSSKKQNLNAETSHWERKIDQLIYQLYQLTPEEIQILENIH